MTERPILFSGPMVRAILAGEKVETRRVVKLREFQPSETKGYDFTFRDRRMLWNDVRAAALVERWCPYGAPGDRLWVRETWRTEAMLDGHSPAKMPADTAVWYDANLHHGEHVKQYDQGLARRGWVMVGRTRASLHMPRWASRLTLAVESVRVERLHDIDDEGARREGVADREAFRALWCDINGADSWASNPWVWVLGFSWTVP